MRAKFSDFQKQGMVSVWVGDFRTEDDLDDYLHGQFESDFGFALYDRAVQEIGVEAEPVSVEQLVILIRFQDETNRGRVGGWQDHVEWIHSSSSGRK